MYEFEQFVEKSIRAETVDELARIYSNAIEAEGYENCILTTVRSREVSHIAWFDVPEDYVDAYIEKRWSQIDPFLECSLRARRPFLWSDVIAQTNPTQRQTNFLPDCKDLVVHSGIVFPLHGPGDRLDIISISKRMDDPVNPEHIGLLHATSVQTWQRYLELTEEDRFVELENPPLTPRELEILRWCKHGKSYGEIGEILTISHKTVEFHICNVMNKLKATNKISAIVIAIQRGVIDL